MRKLVGIFLNIINCNFDKLKTTCQLSASPKAVREIINHSNFIGLSEVTEETITRDAFAFKPADILFIFLLYTLKFIQL